MFFGDGDGTTNNPPQVSIDDCGHEFGHAITQETSQLVYRWESGALNEGFSDIWAACATNYLKKQFPAIIGKKLDWRLFEESSNVLGGVNAGLRDMADPSIFGQPKFYKGLLWDPGTYEACPIPIGDVNDPNYNDHCGVHDNSGVLNKWFYIVAHGDTAQNEVLRNYSVAGIGFGKADSLAYLTELNLTPNSGYKTARNVSINAAITLWGDNAEAQMVRDAWLAVGVDTAVFNMSNTPAFTTNSFSSIAVGKHGTIWAGTTTNANNTSDGVYRYNGKIWEKAPFLTNNAVAAIQADRNGGIWIAQYGRTGAQALTGGMNYLADSAFSNNTYFGVTTNGLISRNSRSLYVDTFNLTPSNRSVWVSSLAQITVGVSGTGGVSVGFTPGASGNFIKLTKGIEDTSTTGGSQAIAGDKNEVWAFSSLNYLNRSQIVRFSTATADSIGILDSTNIPVLPKQFYVKAMYFDALGKKWLGMLNTGLVVRDEAGHFVTVDTAIFRTIFPYGTIVNNNAIVGDRLGNVYIGTTNGLVYYNKGPLNQVSSFRRFTTAHGLPSNNIRAIAVDTIHYKLLLATDNGIVFFDQICNGWRDCQDQAPTSKSSATSIASGNWSDPSIWNTNKIPDFNTIVRIQNAIQVDIQASCNSLTALPGGNINVQAGKTLKIANGEEEPNPTINEH
jgi:ligand-binding sensor domain-containing protein